MHGNMYKQFKASVKDYCVVVKLLYELMYYYCKINAWIAFLSLR